MTPDMCPQNSADLNPVDYVIWSVIQQRVYETRVHDIDELRQHLLHMWCSLEQSLIDDAVYTNTLVCLCLCQRRTFWTYFVTINLFSLYLMNFMFHTMLDAADDVLRVCHKSMKRHVSQGSRNTIFRWGGYLMCKISSCSQRCKNCRNPSKLWSQMCWTSFFTVDSVICLCALCWQGGQVASETSSCRSKYNHHRYAGTTASSRSMWFCGSL